MQVVQQEAYTCKKDSSVEVLHTQTVHMHIIMLAKNKDWPSLKQVSFRYTRYSLPLLGSFQDLNDS